MTVTRKSLALSILAALALTASAGAQTTWHVDVNGTPPGDGSQGNPYTSLQFCFAQGTTVDGDSVLVAPGTYVEDLNLQGKSLDVRSTAGAAQTTLQAATVTSLVRAVGVAGGRFEGFTMRGGRGTTLQGNSFGGAILCSGSTLELADCELIESEADCGGGIAALAGSTLMLDGCTITENDAQQGGGIYVEGASHVVATDCAVTLNGGDVTNPGAGLQRRGGGVYTIGGATLEMFDCQVTSCAPGISNGTASWTGGGLYLGGTSALLEDCLVAGCGGIGTNSSFAGGVFAGGGVELLRCTIRDNRALNTGGGVEGGHLVDCDVLNNGSTSAGGTYFSELEGCRVVGNFSAGFEGGCGGRGGGAWGGTLTRCRIEGNSTGVAGGGAYRSTLIECEVIGNRVYAGDGCAHTQGGAGLASDSVGGVAVDCRFEGNVVIGNSSLAPVGGGAALGATLTGCTLRGNRVELGSSGNGSRGHLGGATWNCDLYGCLVEGNEALGGVGASAQGGGVHGGSAEGCTIRGNRADSNDPSYTLAMGGGAAESSLDGCLVYDNEADHGGGAWNSDLERCTLVGNLAHEEGGALSVQPHGGSNPSWGAQTVRDSIAWANLPDELMPGMGSIDATWSDVQGGYSGTGNLDLDPDFWSLGTRDLHLRAGSPCIDAGDPNASTDPDGSRRDMGALPFDASYEGGPYGYCTAKESSEGCLPAIDWSGSPTVTGPDDFVVSATAVVPNQNGILFWGVAPTNVPFMGGARCVATPVVRTPPSSSGGAGACTGVLSFAFTQSYLADQGLAPGDRVYAQFWFRDPAQADGTGVGLSNALEFTVLP